MRTIIGLCGVALLAAGFFIWRGTRTPTHYGAFEGAPKTAVTELIERPREFLDKAVLVEGEVRQQCKTMGCYFFLMAGEKMLRVDIQHVAMNAPWWEARPVRVEGQLMPYGDGYQLVANAVEFIK